MFLFYELDGHLVNIFFPFLLLLLGSPEPNCYSVITVYDLMTGISESCLLLWPYFTIPLYFSSLCPDFSSCFENDFFTVSNSAPCSIGIPRRCLKVTANLEYDFVCITKRGSCLQADSLNQCPCKCTSILGSPPRTSLMGSGPGAAPSI